MILFQMKYQPLTPRDCFLKDMYVLVQAWKETHPAIHRYNWYTDVLDVDCSLEILGVLKNSELRQFGENCIRYLVPDAWDQLTDNGISP
ncbi:MAG: hypothetical protein V9G16_08720 [Nitrosomonas sp.]